MIGTGWYYTERDWLGLTWSFNYEALGWAIGVAWYPRAKEFDLHVGPVTLGVKKWSLPASEL